MDLLLICKDASAASLVTNLLWGSAARKAGMEATVLFSAEALAAFCSGAFLWPRELAHQEARLAIADNSKGQNLPIAFRSEARHLDVHGLLAQVQAEGLPMVADPIWTDLLGLRGKLPAGIAELDLADGLKLIGSAKAVVGSL